MTARERAIVKAAERFVAACDGRTPGRGMPVGERVRLRAMDARMPLRAWYALGELSEAVRAARGGAS